MRSAIVESAGARERERERDHNVPASRLMIVQPHTSIWIPGKPRESQKRRAQGTTARHGAGTCPQPQQAQARQLLSAAESRSLGRALAALQPDCCKPSCKGHCHCWTSAEALKAPSDSHQQAIAMSGRSRAHKAPQERPAGVEGADHAFRMRVDQRYSSLGTARRRLRQLTFASVRRGRRDTFLSLQLLQLT